MVEKFKVAKARLVLSLRDSKDENIEKAGIEIKTGRKWSANIAVHQTESRLKHAYIVGKVAERRQGLRISHSESWMKNNNTEKRGMDQAEI